MQLKGPGSSYAPASLRPVLGHVSQKMLEQYSHVRLEAKRRAFEALATTRPESENQGDSNGGYVARNVTKSESEGIPAPQVFQNAGGDDGTRTRGLMRDRHAF